MTEQQQKDGELIRRVLKNKKSCGQWSLNGEDCHGPFARLLEDAEKYRELTHGTGRRLLPIHLRIVAKETGPGMECGEPIEGTERLGTIEYSADHVRVILGAPDDPESPDIYIERRGENAFDIEIHDCPGNPTLIVEWKDNCMEVKDGNGFQTLATIEDGTPI